MASLTSPAIHQAQTFAAIRNGSALGLKAHQVDIKGQTAISQLGGTNAPPTGPARAAVNGHSGSIFVKVPRADDRVFSYAFQAVGGKRGLAARKLLVEAELAKNKPSAPDVYLGTAPFRAQFTPDGAIVDGSIVMSTNPNDGEVIDWGLVMTRLMPHQNLGHMIQDGQDVSTHIPKLVSAIAKMHRRNPSLRQDDPQSHYAAVYNMYSELIVHQIGPAADRAGFNLDLMLLGKLNHDALESCRETIEARCRAGAVGNHHADLHKDNLWIVDGAAVLLDGIAFNDIFAVLDRWQDVAYLIADLKLQGKADLAQSVQDQYIAEMGDKPDEDMMNLYIANRILVRTFLELLELGELVELGRAAKQDDKTMSLVASIEKGLTLAVEHFRKIG
jgi:uncharacterized protein